MASLFFLRRKGGALLASTLRPRPAAWAALLVLSAFLFSAGAALGQEPRFNWKFATLAPEGVGYAVQIKHVVKPKLEEVGQGDIRIKIYWSGVMGDDAGIIRKMRFGHLNGAGLTGSGSIILCPEMSVLSLPFLFSDYDEVDYVRNNMRDDFESYMETSGAFLFAFIDQGFDQIYSKKYSFTKEEDFRAARFLTWYGPVEEEFYRSLGNNPIPVSFPRVLPSLKDDVGDSFMGPAILVVGSTMFTMFKHVNPTFIRYSPACCVIRMEDWNSLPQEYVDAYYSLRDGIENEFCVQNRRDDKKYLVALSKYGISVTRTDPETMAAIREKVKPVWKELEGRVYPPEVLEKVTTHLKHYRNAKASGREGEVR
ncbi:TRAP-type C4-dicarboxylate transport system, substrate-binding protein [Desulfatibacillum alkenivorans DSM 16219]|uniref:TRAP-type C4-dicarboxylate transport system, substrate-binding protein n=1 Tax=Desulfatibacillum alkenivorans DSM 16219 TaxID=1121393 RepID=A0A1M6Y2T5_9BACT|nr:TRAP transporter substrate-binding protein DctP [Desulfatibacillum alkenivorans]SHL12439.1 TRAP-type C4-dicarboxylate transport system, substrate-binding protein [Desulfatibacillum alkenivorans DSM 16219]